MNYKLPLVSIIIPTYNRKDKVIRLIESILCNSYPQNLLDIIVIDDNSIDKTYECLRKRYANSINIRIIRNDAKLYVSGSRNKGIKLAKGELIFFIDDDNILDKDCIMNLVRVITNNPKIGMVGPVMYYWNDKKKIWWAGTKRNMLTSRTYFIGRDLPLPTNKMWETDDFPNSWMVKTDLIFKYNIFFDENKFEWMYEESDFAYKIRAIDPNIKFYVIKDAKIYHDIQPIENDIERLFHLDTEIKAYYLARNRLIFHRKYSKLSQFLIFILIFNWLITLYYLKTILLDSKKPFKKRSKIIKVYLKGIIDGLKLSLTNYV